WAMYPCPQKIPVVTEPLGVVPASGGRQSPGAPADEVLKTILVRVPATVLSGPGQKEVGRVVTALELHSYAVPDPGNLLPPGVTVTGSVNPPAGSNFDFSSKGFVSGLTPP